ncbi:prolyl aminopeptidase [Saccharospirillum sp. MSK14-1]|uniref:prolyl aminopeptidase n=1 Tax=Saccharospirillum sp. MSK14-1 TaxID=1897632 RepID=UPI000D35DB88|nr:prolyl aminopeptidase [Saccharospirillum sp. MSK14-1]PTY37565.1 prolyl aminopeptidase [Saccharospirillum sp. MSK14-1]
MLPLYPEIRPFDRQWLTVSDGHRLYVEQAGTAGALPVVVVHGGPGAGFSEQLRRFFDPEHFHIILYDQRGAGRSEPHAELSHNDTPRLMNDLEALRQHLGIESWVLFGGSWGATLSLLYAQAYPHRCLALILRGVFLARQLDVDWLYGGGAGRYFPEEWERFIEPVSGKTGQALVEDYAKLFNGANDLARVGAAKAWARWEAVNASLRPSQQSLDYFSSTHVALSLARVGCHYIRQQFFIEPDQILQQADRLAGIPGYLVHGRYDMVCPPDQAWQLAQRWPDAELDLVREGGHSGFDAAMVDALIRATQNVAQRFGQGDEEA